VLQICFSKFAAPQHLSTSAPQHLSTSAPQQKNWQLSTNNCQLKEYLYFSNEFKGQFSKYNKVLKKNIGSSGTPLAKKLGIKDNFKIKLVNQPANYFKLFSDMPESIKQYIDKRTLKDFIHYFEVDAEELYKNLAELKEEIVQDGMIWVSWYKQAANIKTDITEDTIRDYALQIGLVDIKVCAIDEEWSGLKLVIPVKDRK